MAILPKITAHNYPIAVPKEGDSNSFRLYTNNGDRTIQALSGVSIINNELVLVDISDEVSALNMFGITSNTASTSEQSKVYMNGILIDINIITDIGSHLFVQKDGTISPDKPTVGENNFEIGDFIISVGRVISNKSDSSKRDLAINIDLIGQL